MFMASIIQGEKKEVRKHKRENVKWNEFFLQVGLQALNPLAKNVTSGSKGNRRGGPTKSEGAQDRFPDQTLLLNGCLLISIF